MHRKHLCPSLTLGSKNKEEIALKYFQGRERVDHHIIGTFALGRSKLGAMHARGVRVPRLTGTSFHSASEGETGCRVLKVPRMAKCQKVAKADKLQAEQQGDVAPQRSELVRQQGPCQGVVLPNTAWVLLGEEHYVQCHSRIFDSCWETPCAASLNRDTLRDMNALTNSGFVLFLEELMGLCYEKDAWLTSVLTFFKLNDLMPFLLFFKQNPASVLRLETSC